MPAIYLNPTVQEVMSHVEYMFWLLWDCSNANNRPIGFQISEDELELFSLNVELRYIGKVYGLADYQLG